MSRDKTDRANLIVGSAVWEETCCCCNHNLAGNGCNNGDVLQSQGSRHMAAALSHSRALASRQQLVSVVTLKVIGCGVSRGPHHCDSGQSILSLFAAADMCPCSKLQQVIPKGGAAAAIAFARSLWQGEWAAASQSLFLSLSKAVPATCRSKTPCMHRKCHHVYSDSRRTNTGWRNKDLSSGALLRCLCHVSGGLTCCAGCTGVALPLAVTLQQLCLRAPRRSRAALSVLACIMFFLALICLGNPPSQPHPFWAPLEPTRSWDRYAFPPHNVWRC